jgi:hypothetical protein
MTKKDLIEFLKDYPDDTKIKCFDGGGSVDAVIEDYSIFLGKTSVLISGGFYDD